MQLPSHRVHALIDRLLSLSLPVGRRAVTTHVAYYNIKKISRQYFRDETRSVVFFWKGKDEQGVVEVITDGAQVWMETEH